MRDGNGKRYLRAIAVVFLTTLVLTGCQKTTFTEIKVGGRIPDTAMNKYFSVVHDTSMEHAAVVAYNGTAYLIVSLGLKHKLDLHIKFLDKAVIDDSGTVATIYFETYDPKIPYTISPVDAAQITDYESIVTFKQGKIHTVKVVVNDVEKYELQVIE